MFARVEVGYRPEMSDPAAQGFLRRAELALPEIRKQIRWARMIDVFWLDLPCPREEVIPGIGEVFWDRVTQWMFTGNLIPSAAGKFGNMQDLLETAPHRPGKFWAIERRYRPGVTDHRGRTALEALEIVLGKKLEGGRIAAGTLVVLEGPRLDERVLGQIAQEVFCNDLIETWTIVPERELMTSDRFHQERIKYEFPRTPFKGSDRVVTFSLSKMSDSELTELSDSRLLALTLDEMKAIQRYYSQDKERVRRTELGLSDPTDVELEMFAQTWSEHCKHKIFGAVMEYEEEKASEEDALPVEIPNRVMSLYKTTIKGTTEKLPKPWLLSVFTDNAGIVAFDQDEAVCIKVETHNSPSALDPYGGSLTGIVGVNRDILGCGLGAKPIANTDVFCLARPDYSDALPERIMHPRRILDGVRRGVEDGGNQSGIPTVNGALVFDDRFLGKPLIFCGTLGRMPRRIAGRPCESKEIQVGDRICMVGGRIGKDGIHGATFSSLALTETSPTSAVQLGDPLTQRRMTDFLLEARDLGLYRCVTDNGAGGLSSSVGELAQLSGGARMDVGLAKTKYPGLKPYELVVSESQERMTVAVPPPYLQAFLQLAERRGVEVSVLGDFTDTGRIEILYNTKRVADIELEFLHQGTPVLSIPAKWKKPAPRVEIANEPYTDAASIVLTELLGQPNVCSKEWLIRQYDHEVQGSSVIKPLHSVLNHQSQVTSGPNDGGVVQLKPGSDIGVVVGCGLNPKLSDIDPYWMAQSAVDEAIRNVLAVGAEYGTEESVLALVDNFCWPDPVKDPQKAAALVRACYGMQEAALALGTPFVSGKDSMKNDYRGKLKDQPIQISVPPTLLVTALGRVPEIRFGRTSDFKNPRDLIYLLGVGSFGLVGSEFWSMRKGRIPERSKLGKPDWIRARTTYSWLGGALGKEVYKLRSLHDISDGGFLTAVAEGCLARGFGAHLELREDQSPWEQSFGEGFHTFVASVSEADAAVLESEWERHGIPFRQVGTVIGQEQLRVTYAGKTWNIGTDLLRRAWQKAGYWE